MKKIIKIHTENEPLSVYWTLTDYCNYSCNYCPTYLHAGDYAQNRKPGFPTDSEIILGLDRLIEFATARNQKIKMMIGGGEPTVHPMFETIIEKLSPHGSITIVTNGSRPLQWWKNLAELPTEIIISMHPEFTKIDKINLLGEYILSEKSNLMFNMNCDTKNWDRVVEMYNTLDPILQRCVRPKILQDWNNSLNGNLNYKYTDEQWAWINSVSKQTNLVNRQYSTLVKLGMSVRITYDNNEEGQFNFVEMFKDGNNKFKDWMCGAGMNGISISYNGNVTGAVCQAVSLGKLHNFNLLNEYIVCHKNECGCPSDQVIGKYKIL